ncbi:hypothetical protein [Actinocorallia herbida]|uniref:hypothetical protein n=1 Tax=Actinocorallia herbida TaxID=58109 RepID=UPI0011CDDB28|nr:hypothetical protein [Actinocorallia herbida]
MGARAISVRLSGDGARHAWAEAVHHKATEAIWREVGLDPAGDLAYYAGAELSRTVDGDAASWWFGDPGGCCGRSAHAWAHWFEHVLCAGWPLFTHLAGEHGLVLEGSPPAYADLTAGGALVVLRRGLWIAEESGLFGDDAHVPLADLTPGERAAHASARRHCQCTLCVDLPPEVR